MKATRKKEPGRQVTVLSDEGSERTHSHPVRLHAISVALATLTAISLLTPYYSSADVNDPWAFLTKVSLGASSNGGIALVLLSIFLTLLYIRLLGILASEPRRLRVPAVIGGALVSWSITFAGSNIGLDGEEFTAGVGQVRLIILLYQGVRWLSVGILVTALLSWLFLLVVVHEDDGEGKDGFLRGACRGGGIFREGRLEELGMNLTTLCRRCFPKAPACFSSMSAHNVMVIAVVILLCWSPWLVLMGPANIAADTVAQLVWARTGRAWDPSSHVDLPAMYSMSDHHPWFDTVVYGAFDALGLSIGNEAAGLWLLALVQAVALAVSFAILLVYLGARAGIGWQWCVCGTVFYGLVPIYGRLVMSVVKDMTFMPFYVIWSVMFVDYVRRLRSGERISPRFLIVFLLLALMCGLTKKIGIYVILASFLVVLVFVHGRLLTVTTAAAAVALYMLVSTLACSALRVAPGGYQEALGVPLQQAVGVLLRHPDDLSDEERQSIMDMFTCPEEQLRNVFTNAGDDPVKDLANRAVTSAQKKAFLHTWIMLGVRHPVTYFQATGWVPSFFMLDGVYDEGFYVRGGWSDKGGAMILPQFADGEMTEAQHVAQTLYQLLQALPVVGLLMREGVYALWIPLISVLLCCVRKRLAGLLYLTPSLLTIATMLVQPTHQFRYTWPLAFCAVLIIAVPFVRDSVSSNGGLQSS